MSPRVEQKSLAELLVAARASLGESLQVVAADAGCSPAYVHKLEQGKVRTPSPRVLAGLARALGLEYELLMQRAGYDSPLSQGKDLRSIMTSRFSNAHIVELLEQLLGEVTELKAEITRLGTPS